MAELLESPGNFYLNAEQYNATSEPIEASITIEDRSDILSRQDNWMVHVTRFAIDTQASLYYIPPDSTATVTLTVFDYHETAHHRIDQTRYFRDQRTVTLEKGASTLAGFLQLLNDGVPTLRDIAQDTPVVGNSPVATCGRWTVTSSGAFKFTAGVYGIDATVAQHATATPEFFVNIKCSESMRKYLGFKNANLNIQGNESTLQTWKKTLANFYTALSTYRNDIDNWRWKGTATQSYKAGYWADMHEIVNINILDAVSIDTNGHIDDHYGAPQDRITAHAFWKVNDYVVANFQSAPIHGAQTKHECTFFGRIQFLDHTGGVDQVTLVDEEDEDADCPPDSRFDGDLTAANQYNFTQLVNEPRMSRWAFHVNAKQLWGTWSRAYVLKVVNRRQIIINRVELTNTTPATAEITNVGLGGATYDGPLIGDTMYLHSPWNYDAHEPQYPNLNPPSIQQYRTGVVVATETVSIDRTLNMQGAADVPDDTGYLVTLDWTLEPDAWRAERAGPLPTGVPQMRVVFGTRRIPLSTPMVYVAQVAETVHAVNGGIQFQAKIGDTMPVTVGDLVYVGHDHGDSKDPHAVTHVDHSSLKVTIAAGELTQIAANTVVIGMAKSSVYDAVLQADAVGHQITCAAPFIQANNCAINHAALDHKLSALETALELRRSTKHILVRSSTNFGVHTITEDETGIPQLNSIDAHTGNVTIPSGVVESSWETGFNCAVISDIAAHIGASPSFNPAHPETHTNHNHRNLCPSNYFCIDMPYPATDFRTFFTAHIREDWRIRLVNCTAQDTLTAVSARADAHAYDIIDPDRVVQFGSNHCVQENGRWPHDFRVCGSGQFDAFDDGGGSVGQAQKFVVYLFDRRYYPTRDPDGGAFSPDEFQFWRAYMGEDIPQRQAQYPAGIARYELRSGWRAMDAVQAVYKANTTLSLDNVAGINLSLRTEDNCVSELNGQVDLAFPYKSISLTSNDLLAVPERSGDANELQPVLSSYSIPSMFSAGVGSDGTVASFTSSPYGTVTFSEGGARRYHQLTAIPGGLRRFQVNAVLDPKNDRYAKTKISIPAGGRFSCQLLFVRKI